MQLQREIRMMRKSTRLQGRFHGGLNAVQLGLQWLLSAGVLGLTLPSLANPTVNATTLQPNQPGARLGAGRTAVRPYMGPAVVQQNQPALPSPPGRGAGGEGPVAQSETTQPETFTTPNCACQLELNLLTPDDRDVLDTTTAVLVVRYDARQTMELRVNGELGDRSLIGKTETTPTGVRTETWYGVALKPGLNTITARTADGVEKTATVKVRGVASQVTVSTVETRIPADGRSTLTVEGQVLDENGNLTNRDTMVTLAANAGQFIGEDGDRLQNGFQVLAKNGRYSAKLQAGNRAQLVQIRAAIPGFGRQIGAQELEAFTQTQFTTSLRPSIATGVINLRIGGEGNDFYGKLRDFLPLDGDNDTVIDLKGQAFTSGAIGDWLVTGAYNSDRNLNETCDETNRLFRQNRPCELEYPTYGDGSKSEILTPSTDSLFLKFERTSPVANAGPDQFLWGDYKTEEFARRSQQYSALSRDLHGFKGNYNLGELQLSAFFGNNVEGFQRDTIAPDGTSGYYFLSRRDMIEGSENVFLELEELNRPGTVLQRISLVRIQDYDIDYDRGSLFFREPVLRTDIGKEGQTLVRRIVVTYQYDEPGGSDNKIYGGRAQYNFSRERGRETWLAGTYIREDKGSRDYELFGIDSLVSLGDKATLIAEYAHSSNDAEILGNVDGSAYRVELNGEIASNVSGNAYFRRAETGFSNNATVSFVPGQTRYGAQVAAAVSPQTSLRLQVDHEKNQGVAPQPRLTFGDLFAPQAEATPGIEVDNQLTTITAGVTQKLGAADLGLDWIYRDRQDFKTNALDETSHQLRSRLTVPLTDRLSFLVQNETTLSREVDPIYSDRSLVGLNWRIFDGVNAQVAQQFFHRGQYAGRQITSLNVTGDYNLTPSTLLRGRYTVFGGQEDLQMQGSLGIKHDIALAPNLKLDLTYERIFGNLLGRNAAADVFAQPFAFGQSAAALGVPSGDSYSIGLAYANSGFQSRLRLEQRNSTSGNNRVLTGAIAGKLSPSLTALATYQQANNANQGITGLLGDSVKFRAGLAYRNPESDTFNALLRYEYRRNPSTVPDTVLFGSGTGYHEHLFGLEAVYAPSWQWELFGKFALRNSVSYLADDLVGSSTITLAQGRITHRFAQRWDVAGEVRWINQGSTGYGETGALLEVGHYLNPNLRFAGGYSLGRASDDDFSGTRTVGGPYFNVQLKLDSLFGDWGLQKWPKPAREVQPANPQPANPQPANPQPANPQPDEVPVGAETNPIDLTPTPETPQPSTPEFSPPVTPQPSAGTPAPSSPSQHVKPVQQQNQPVRALW